MSKFSCFCFLATPPIKLKLELHINGGLLTANHLDQSLWSANQKYWTTVRCNLLPSFWEVPASVAPFTSHGTLHEFSAEKPISWGEPAHFNFFAINFTVWSHILSTVGDALRHVPPRNAVGTVQWAALWLGDNEFYQALFQIITIVPWDSFTS
jgi:hypothetical protein